MLTRICDWGDCEKPALFSVGVWNESSQRLEDTADVCGVDHARKYLARWLKLLADIEADSA